MAFDLKELGNNIRNLRKSRPSSARPGRSLLQFELAERAGIPTSSLCNIENGRYRNPTWHILSKIARGLECDISDLFRNGEDRLSPSQMALEEMIEILVREKLDSILSESRNHL